MRAGVGAVVANGDPEFVENRRIQRQQVDGSGFARVDERRAHVPVQVVHVKPLLAEREGRVRADVLHRPVQAEADEQSAAACLTDAEDPLAVVGVDIAVGGVGQLQFRVRRRGEAGSEGHRDPVIEDRVGIGDLRVRIDVVREVEPAVVAARGPHGVGVLEGQDAVGGLDATNGPVAGTPAQAVPGIDPVVPIPGAIERGRQAVGGRVALVDVSPPPLRGRVAWVVDATNGQLSRCARDRAGDVRDNSRVKPGVGQLEIEQDQGTVGLPGQVASAFLPLVGQRRRAGGNDREGLVLAFEPGRFGRSLGNVRRVGRAEGPGADPRCKRGQRRPSSQPARLPERQVPPLCAAVLNEQQHKQLSPAPRPGRVGTTLLPVANAFGNVERRQPYTLSPDLQTVSRLFSCQLGSMGDSPVPPGHRPGGMRKGGNGKSAN